MPALLTKSTCSNYNVRSFSFPAKSHPTLCKIEEELNKFSSWELSSSSTNAETIRARLSGLGKIYKYIEDLLNLPMTQQSLSNLQEEKWVSDEMLDDLIKYLDICSNTRDTILLMKESIRELQSAFRRSKGGGDSTSSIERNVNAYICSRKMMTKAAAKFLATLKQKDGISAEAELPLLKTDDHYLSAVVKGLKETSWVTISAISSLLIFLSVPISKPKPSKWALLSKFVYRGAVVACEWQQENMNELENVDLALTNLLEAKDLELQKIQSAQKMLEILDIRMEEFENELECLLRHLIHTRVSLLNIVSHKLE